MRTDETLRLRLAEIRENMRGAARALQQRRTAQIECAETRANVESARAQVAEERLSASRDDAISARTGRSYCGFISCPRCNGVGFTPTQDYPECDDNCSRCKGSGIVEGDPF